MLVHKAPCIVKLYAREEGTPRGEVERAEAVPELHIGVRLYMFHGLLPARVIIILVSGNVKLLSPHLV